MTTISTPRAAKRGKPVAAGKPRRPGQATGTAVLMLLPAALLLITFLLIPIGLTFVLAFTDARLISPRPAQFTGMDNFTRLFADETFWKSLRNTIIFAIIIVPVQSGLRPGAGLAGQRQDARRQLLPDGVLPSSRHLHGGRVDAVAVPLPEERPDQPGAVPLRDRRPGLAGRPAHCAASPSSSCPPGRPWASTWSSGSPASRPSRATCTRPPTSTAPGRGRSSVT